MSLQDIRLSPNYTAFQSTGHTLRLLTYSLMYSFVLRFFLIIVVFVFISGARRSVVGWGTTL
jgi:hypothetical protein